MKTSNYLSSLSLALLLLGCASDVKKIELLDEGVPLELARYRKLQLGEVHYALSFDIPESAGEPINSELLLTVRILDRSRPLYLDFKEDPDALHSVRVNEAPVPVNFEKEHLIIPKEHLVSGENTVYIRFRAGELSLNRNEDYLYTLLVPDRARTLFPCFDQPDIKATYSLQVSAPAAWEVLSAASLESRKESGNRALHRFHPSDTLSTYLFSMVAGRFNTATSNNSPRPMKLLYRETDSAKIRASTDTIFALHTHALEFLEHYTNYRFPFQKLDFAALPGFQYGGMEHVGAIQYRESSLFLDSSATGNQELGRAKLIAHETAHMWFGDLVTMNWFNDVWLKEVFANFMADKIINPVFPETNHNLQFTLDHHTSAYGIDRSRGSNPIRQDLKNLNDAGSLYGAIIYHKAPIMMRQLESILGETLFRKGLQEYLRTYAFGNAGWPQLITIFDAHSPLDISEWSRVWVHATGRPLITSDIDYREDGTMKSFILHQQAEDGSGNLWPQLFDISLVYPDTIISRPVRLYEKQVNLTGLTGLKQPDYIIYNSNGYGYGVFPMTPELLRSLHEIPDEVARGYSYINCFESTLNGNLRPAEALELFRKGVLTESNELILRYLANSVGQLFWYYLDEVERNAYGEAMEKQLFDRLSGQAPPAIKKTLFGMFRSLAYSNWGKDQLYRIWRKELTVQNLLLNEDDFTALAMNLAVYGHKATPEILNEARRQISNPDKIDRFEFLLPALSQDPIVRETFFKSLKNPGMREKENWVLTAAYYIHHPLRQEEAIQYLPMSLQLLPELAATGDIFFPKAWLDNTIGLYRSEEAHAILEAYLEREKALNPLLRSKLLQATDDLFRVQELKKEAKTSGLSPEG